MTLLTASEFAPVTAALGEYHAWLEANAHLFTADRLNVAPIGLLYPGESLWLDWHRLAPLFYGAGQALTLAGIPWRVVRSSESLNGLRAVLDVLDRLDARGHTQALADDYTERALRELEQTEIRNQAQERLRVLAAFLTARSC